MHYKKITIEVICATIWNWCRVELLSWAGTYETCEVIFGRLVRSIAVVLVTFFHSGVSVYFLCRICRWIAWLW